MKMLSALLLCSFLCLLPVHSQEPTPTPTAVSVVDSSEFPKGAALTIVPENMVLPEVVIATAITISKLPKVGPIFLEIMKWLSIVASVFTFLCGVFFAFVALPEFALRWAGFHSWADKFKVVYDKVYPWLSYLSILNSKLGQRK